MSATVERVDVLVADAARTSTSPSAVSWGAIFAGAAAAASLSLILLLLGTGLGLSSVSPWASEGIDASTFGISSILWVTFMQLAASAVGGYLAGRLRTKWAGVHTDEVYFRDTAHGFLAWAVATITTAALLTSVIGGIVSGGIQAGATAVAGATSAATVGGAAAVGSEATEPGSGNGPMGYFVDSLFRSESPDRGASPESAAAATAEIARIFANAIRMDAMPDEDVRYIGQVIAQRTDLSQREAEQRVRDVLANIQAAETEAKATADAAREASAYAALWLFISLLIGAFIASWMATFGGRQRDL